MNSWLTIRLEAKILTKEALAAYAKASVKEKVEVVGSSADEQVANLTLRAAKLNIVKALMDIVQKREFSSLDLTITPLNK